MVGLSPRPFRLSIPPRVRPGDQFGVVNFDFRAIADQARQAELFSQQGITELRSLLSLARGGGGALESSAAANLAAVLRAADRPYAIRVAAINNAQAYLTGTRDRGRFQSDFLRAAQAALGQDVIPRLTENYARGVDAKITKGVGGRAPYRNTGAFRRQRRRKLLIEGLREAGIWTQRPGAAGIRFDLRKLDQFRGRRSDSTTLKQYWRIQEAGSSVFLNRRIMLLGGLGRTSGGAVTTRNPGFRSIRDISSRRASFQRRPTAGNFRTATVKNRIQGYGFAEDAQRIIQAALDARVFEKALTRRLAAAGLAPIRSSSDLGASLEDFGRIRRAATGR